MAKTRHKEVQGRNPHSLSLMRNQVDGADTCYHRYNQRYYFTSLRMVTTCVVPCCRKRSDRCPQLRYFRIPAIRTNEGSLTRKLSDRRRATWIARINRGNFQPTAAHRVCSLHFAKGKDFMKPGSVSDGYRRPCFGVVRLFLQARCDTQYSDSNEELLFDCKMC